ncbi:MAG: hypothetical protein BWZ10_01502 [candidate division BRC1 bacterium ADurb.BinA364]|nr:MAG: hypothetical protein BWZ10_01502 [candidate division BRC1 bacterium ADurb.BinA364]
MSLQSITAARQPSRAVIASATLSGSRGPMMTQSGCNGLVPAASIVAACMPAMR